MASFLDKQPQQQISKQEYQVFCKEYIFEQLKGKRFGRAFCERFDINDMVVNCLVDEDIAREMIEENYIQ
jgi:hypothetical protein